MRSYFEVPSGSAPTFHEFIHHEIWTANGLRHAESTERARWRTIGVHGITIGAHIWTIRTRGMCGGARHHLRQARDAYAPVIP